MRELQHELVLQTVALPEVGLVPASGRPRTTSSTDRTSQLSSPYYSTQRPDTRPSSSASHHGVAVNLLVRRAWRPRGAAAARRQGHPGVAPRHMHGDERPEWSPFGDRVPAAARSTSSSSASGSSPRPPALTASALTNIEVESDGADDSRRPNQWSASATTQ